MSEIVSAQKGSGLGVQPETATSAGLPKSDRAELQREVKPPYANQKGRALSELSAIAELPTREALAHVPRLTRLLLTSNDEGELSAVLKALTKAADPNSLEPLAAFAERQQISPGIRKEAISCMERMHERTAFDKLMEIVQRPSVDADVRVAAALAIGSGREEIEDSQQIVNSLKCVYMDRAQPPIVRAAASDAIQDFRSSECKPLWESIVKNAGSEPREIVQDAVTSLWVEHATARTLDRAEGKAFLSDIHRLLTDPSVHAAIRGDAAFVAGQSKYGAATPSLISMLKDPKLEDRLRSSCASALANSGSSEAWKVLVDVLNECGVKGLRADPICSLPATIIRSLGDLRDPAAVPPLCDYLKRVRDPDVQDLLVEALGAIGDPKAISALRAIEPTEDCLRRQLALALGKLKDPEAIPALVELAQAGNRDKSAYDEALNAAEVLVAYGSKEAAKALYCSMNTKPEMAGAQAHMLDVCFRDTPEKFSIFRRQLHELADSPENSEEAAGLEAYANALDRCRKLGIPQPMVFTPDSLVEIVKNIESNNAPEDKLRALDGRPSLLMSVGRYDPHCVFSHSAGDFAELTKRYHVILKTAGSDEELMKGMKDGAHVAKGDFAPFDDILIMAHGRQTMMGMSPNARFDGANAEVFDLSDLKRFKDPLNGVVGIIKEGGNVFLLSCQVGHGGDHDLSTVDNMVEACRSIWPHANTVRGPINSTEFEGFAFDINGRVQDLNYTVPTYTLGRQTAAADREVSKS